MEAFKHQRQTIKSALTRIQNFCQSPNAALSEIRIRMDKAEDLFKQYEYVQQQIDSLTLHSDQGTEETYRIEMEERYFALKSIFSTRLHEEPAEARSVMTIPSSSDSQSINGLNVAVQALLEHQSTMSTFIERMSNQLGNTSSMPTTSQQNNPVSQQSSQHHELRLPRIDIPDFDGNYINWTRFRDLFEAMVHNRTTISAVEKLEYLQTKLKGEALSVIKHIKPTNENYTLAWDLVKNKFDKSEKIKRVYFELLFDQSSMKSSAVNEIKRLYNNINESFNALKALNEPVDNWDSILLFFLEKKLDSETLMLWYRRRKSGQEAKFTQFLEFLDERVYELENTQSTKSTHNTQQNLTQKNLRAFPSVVQACPLCKKDHFLYSCNNFKALDVSKRLKVVTSNSICTNCLREKHQVTDCKYSSCKFCNARHNSLLHSPSLPLPVNLSRQLASNEQSNSLSVNSTHQYEHTYTFLPTAVIMVRDALNIAQPCRALLDSGAQSTLITEACVQRLRIKRRYDKTLLYGVAASNGNYTKGKVFLQISSATSEATVATDAFCLSSLTQELPGHEVCDQKLKFFEGLQLADPQFSKPGHIDIILGADVFTNCVLQNKIVHPSGSPSALNTIFGWVIVGRVTDQLNSQLFAAHICVDLDKQLQRFWEVEEFDVKSKFLTPEEEQAENHYNQHVQQQEDGHYVTKLPFKTTNPEFGDSKTAAFKRLYAVERRFINNQQLQTEYIKFMHEFINLGHMEISAESPPGRTFYLPHHAVLKPTSTTTKLRVVFDASCKTSNGLSLNDQLLVGPTIQNDLFTLLIKFRKYQFGFTGDIEKMYRQILIHPDDRSYQRILWRDSNKSPIKEYNLKTVTYGTASAPFLAVRTLKQAALDNMASSPEAADEIMQSFYVDDFMSCSADLATSIKLREDVCKILNNSGFHLRKWSSNSSEFLEQIPVQDRESSSETIIDNTQTVKTLGLLWDTTHDCFKYSVSLAAIQPVVTKRAVLSDISKVFDPLGWLSPVVVAMKIFMQKLWFKGVDWDQPLSDETCSQWFKYRDNINTIKNIRIPRWIRYANEVNIELHGFADSSELAYAAAIYLRVQHTDGSISTNLIAAKTRVAPAKPIPLPHLELCAAQLMTKLITKIHQALNFTNVKLFGWSDSTIVLAWLADHPRRWKTFIANRTSYIINLIPAQQWQHIRSKQNPADLATRGILPSELISNSLWWHGPEVLKEVNRMQVNCPEVSPDVDMEERKEFNINVTTTTNHELVSRYSNLNKLIRITALLLRFVNNCKTPKTNTEKTIGFLTAIELQSAHDVLVRKAQQTSFQKEIRILSSDKQLQLSHKFASLAPFIDNAGVLRVGGRIENAKVNYNQKHQYILSKEHNLTDLIIKDYHVRYLHAGSRQLQYLLGLKYYIPGVIRVIKRCVYKCTTCMRLRGIPYHQQMGNIPQYRFEAGGSAFLNVGVDSPVQCTSNHGKVVVPKHTNAGSLCSSV